MLNKQMHNDDEIIKLLSSEQSKEAFIIQLFVISLNAEEPERIFLELTQCF